MSLQCLLTSLNYAEYDLYLKYVDMMILSAYVFTSGYHFVLNKRCSSYVKVILEFTSTHLLCQQTPIKYVSNGFNIVLSIINSLK